ncbi:MAG TPA: hypothetical protein VGM86_03545, partial [Thermoanaerobaculia bacterium]
IAPASAAPAPAPAPAASTANVPQYTIDQFLATTTWRGSWLSPDGKQLLVSGNGIVGNWVFRTELFEPSTIQRLAQGFKAMAAQIVLNPECRLDDLSLAPEAERVDRDRKRRERELRLLSLRSAGNRTGVAVAEASSEEGSR